MLVVFLLVIGTDIMAQSANYDEFISRVREGNNPSLPYDLLRAQSPGRLLPEIEPYLEDTLVSVRRAAYQSLDVMQQNSTRPGEKLEILQIQFRGLEDPAPEIVGLTIDYLGELPASLFTDGQKSVLVNLLDRPVPRKEVLIQLTGSLGTVQAIPALQRLSLPGNSSKIRWAAYLALARLGDEDAINDTEQKVRELAVNSEVVYNILPGIIYTRQKQLYDYLVEELYRDARNCEPADPDQSTPINCAYRILEMLAPQVEDFPLATTASGDLETRNYRKALQTARDWFTSNPGYRIITESN